MSKEKVIPIIDIPYNSINPRVIVTGDPYRAEKIATLCENVTVVSKAREYWTYNGTYKGVPVTIASNGCGAAGALLCFEGLILGGAKVMIRVGTGGFLADGYKAGDMLVITAAVREEKVMEQVVPLSYPAVSNIDVTLNLQKAAKARGVDVKTGMCVTAVSSIPSCCPRICACSRRPVFRATRMRCRLCWSSPDLRASRRAASSQWMARASSSSAMRILTITPTQSRRQRINSSSSPWMPLWQLRFEVSHYADNRMEF